MKQSKKALKQIFGNHSEGLKYMEAVLSNEKSPILFAEGPGAAAFAEWMSHLMNDHAILDHHSFNNDHNNRSESLLIVKDVDEIHDGTIQAAVAARDNYKNVVISSKKHPKLLDYVNDPAFQIIYVDDLNIDDLKREISSLMDVIS
ncbi:MAG: hypothetical protein ACPGJS_01180 [Flammeovirgaceae bacterium]